MSARMYAFYQHAIHGKLCIQFILSGNSCRLAEIRAGRVFEISELGGIHAPDGNGGIPEWIYEFVQSDQMKSIMVSELGGLMRSAEYVRNQFVKAGAS